MCQKPNASALIPFPHFSALTPDSTRKSDTSNRDVKHLSASYCSISLSCSKYEVSVASGGLFNKNTTPLLDLYRTRPVLKFFLRLGLMTTVGSI